MTEGIITFNKITIQDDAFKPICFIKLVPRWRKLLINISQLYTIILVIYHSRRRYALISK